MPKFNLGEELRNQVKVDEIAIPDKIKLVKIESLLEAHLEYTGRVSGKLYHWQKAGDIVLVDEADVPELLSKHLGKKMCCGSGDNRIFQIAM